MNIFRQHPGQTQKTGQAAERHAEKFLKDQGLKLLKRNFRCKTGEIDLIMRDGSTLVFVEVRYRRRAEYGDGAATVTWHKQQRLIRTAQYYLQRSSDPDCACRFDVIAAYQGPEHQQDIQLDWIRNAFDAL